MKSYIITAAIAAMMLGISPALSAQTAANPEGTMIYALPKTTLTLKVTAEKETFLAGPYAQYARKYLGNDARTEDAVTYSVKSIDMVPYIEADLDNTYTVSLSAKDASSSGFVKMCSQGIIALSDSYTGKEDAWRFPSLASNDRFNGKEGSGNLTTSTTTLYRTEKTADGFRRVAVQQSEVVEKSLEKKAAEAAQTIFSLRKSRIQIITGDTDATFSGEALKAAIDEITRLEEEYLTLFYGITERSLQTMQFDVTPDAANSRQMYVAFRISDTEGLLPSDNLAGRPVVLQITGAKAKEAQISDAAGRKAAGTRKQIYYRIPATSTVRILDGEEMLLQSRVPVYQLGSTASVTF
ncbi:MAG: DUF4831 family protein [Bacteroidales bacterium]|nr:DUF4831 family protein [Bacteroidales bacterium]